MAAGIDQGPAKDASGARVVKPLDECTVFISGGSSGIGLASARAFAKAGVRRIAIFGRNAERGDAAAASVQALGANCTFHSAEVTDHRQVAAALQDATDVHGNADVMLNCAGVGGNHAPLPFLDQAPEDFASVIATSFYDTLYFCRAVLPAMRDNGFGVIINTGSDAAKVTTPGETVIGGMMAAIAMFSRTLAMEVGRYNVRVNALSPSIVQNTRSYDMVMSSPFSRKLFAKAEGRARLGIVQPDDLAGLAVFLASPATARLTGQVISVNGGISAG
jgi:NAD(P)-dependent dehydrogenase (short-subunit alcohol dehydrogenase family)